MERFSEGDMTGILGGGSKRGSRNCSRGIWERFSEGDQTGILRGVLRGVLAAVLKGNLVEVL